MNAESFAAALALDERTATTFNENQDRQPDQPRSPVWNSKAKSFAADEAVVLAVDFEVRIILNREATNRLVEPRLLPVIPFEQLRRVIEARPGPGLHDHELRPDDRGVEIVVEGDPNVAGISPLEPV